MEVVNPRTGLLSNYEVLTWLQELESDHLLRTKTALRVKKEEEVSAAASGGTQVSALSTTSHLEASENLRTVEVEAISYLSAEYLPTSSQSENGITSLVKNLAAYSLTKAEKLQIVNLAPTLPVELYVIVEELEDRFGQQIDEILDTVKASLSTTSNNSITVNHVSNEQGGPTIASSNPVVIVEGDQQWDEDADAVFDEEYFDDGGAGVGVEGDLEMDED